jgi:hypothetical protein
MGKRTELYVIREPETAVESNVIRISGIRSHGPAAAARVGPPWPPQLEWEDFLHRWKSQYPAAKTGV